jgi:hypothetical protein
MVPDVTEYWLWQALHLNLRLVVMLYAAAQPQQGQMGAPFVSGQRILQKAS